MRLPQGAFVTYISHINYHLIYHSQVAVRKCVYVVFQTSTQGKLNTWLSAGSFNNVVILDYHIQSVSMALWWINHVEAS